VLPPDITEVFLPRQGALLGAAKLRYRPGLLATTRVHFVQKSADIDHSEDLALFVPAVEEISAVLWDQSERLDDSDPDTESDPDPDAVFETPPSELSRSKTFTELTSALKNHIYRTVRLDVWRCSELKVSSKPGETEGDFRVRLAQGVKEERDLAVEKLRTKYTPKLAALEERLRKAQQRLEKQKSQASSQTIQTAVSIGTSILGAMFGRKLTSATNINRAASTIRSATKIANERQDVAQANESVEAVQSQIDKLNEEFTAETTKIQDSYNTDGVKLEQVSVAPKKTDITIIKVALAWTPWIMKTDGTAEAAY